MIDEYLSIADFATKANVSKQAIYKQVNNENSRLAPYVSKNGKQTLIKKDALLILYGVVLPETTPNQPETTINQPEQTTYSTHIEQPISTDYVDFLKKQIAELQTEHTRLNNVISSKDAIINEQANKIAELAQQITEIAKGALITTAQQQQLSASDSENKKTIPFWKRFLLKK